MPRQCRHVGLVAFTWSFIERWLSTSKCLTLFIVVVFLLVPRPPISISKATTVSLLFGSFIGWSHPKRTGTTIETWPAALRPLIGREPESIDLPFCFRFANERDVSYEGDNRNRRRRSKKSMRRWRPSNSGVERVDCEERPQIAIMFHFSNFFFHFSTDDRPGNGRKRPCSRVDDYKVREESIEYGPPFVIHEPFQFRGLIVNHRLDLRPSLNGREQKIKNTATIPHVGRWRG